MFGCVVNEVCMTFTAWAAWAKDGNLYIKSIENTQEGAILWLDRAKNGSRSNEDSKRWNEAVIAPILMERGVAKITIKPLVGQEVEPGNK